MTTIATLAVKLIADAGGFLATMDQAEEKSQTWSQNVSRNLKDVGGKMTDFGQGMTTRVTLPILGVGIAAVKFASDLLKGNPEDEVSEEEFAKIIAETKEAAK